jgi:hypothetical protein
MLPFLPDLATGAGVKGRARKIGRTHSGVACCHTDVYPTRSDAMSFISVTSSPYGRLRTCKHVRQREALAP